MKIFVTGATGYIGKALVPVLTRAGHEVVALVRTPAKAAEAKALGAAETVLGSIGEPDSYRDAAAESDALIHAAHDYAKDGTAKDKLAVETLLEMGKLGPGRVFIYTSGVWVLGNCPSPADEKASTAHPLPMVAWRAAHERLVLDNHSSSLSTPVIRPGLVYGGKGGLLANLFATAEKSGASEFVGDGKNRWPLVHRDDLAELYRIVVETQGEGVFHGVDGAPLTALETARLASQAAGAGGKTRSIPYAEAKQKLGPLADALVQDQVVIAPRARGLGWQARYASFAQGAVQAYAEWKA